MLTAFSKREQPGYVVGLSRHHHPVRASWQEDAEAWAERLRTMALAESAPAGGPEAEALYGQIIVALAALERAAPTDRAAAEEALRGAVRAALAGGVAATDARLVRSLEPVAGLFSAPEFGALARALAEDGVGAAPAEWPWLSRTRGRRAVVLGGEPAEATRQDLQRALQLSEVEWVATAGVRAALQSLRDRVRAGRVDLVLVDAASVGHEPDELLLPACRERGVDLVHVDGGLGLARVRAAVERTLPVG